MDVSLEIAIFEFQTTFGCFGGCGGLGMCCGTEIIVLLCFEVLCACMVLQEVRVYLC